MKTKIKRHSRSVLSVILAVTLLLSSSVVAMFISNAVVDPSEPVSASVTDEGVVGADDDNESLGEGGAGQWGLWIGTSDRDGMNSYLALTSYGDNQVSATKTLTRNDFFMSLTCGYTENWHYNYQWSSSATITNNYSSVITSAQFGKQEYYASSTTRYDVYRLQMWCNVANTEVRIIVNTSTKAITIEPTTVIPDIASSVGISASPDHVTSAAPQTTLTATLNSPASGVSGKNVKYTFYADNTSIGSTYSNTGTATYQVSQTDRQTVDYKVTASYTGFTSKTSGTVTVTNSSITNPEFKILGSVVNSNWTTTKDVDQVDSSYGANVYYAEIELTTTTLNSSSNRFRLKNDSVNHKGFACANVDSDQRDPGETAGYGKILNVDGDSYTACKLGDGTHWDSNYFQINPPQAGTYRIYVDQTNVNSPVVWITGERDVFITSVTTFNNYVDYSGTVHYVTNANVSNFEAPANTKFKGYKSGSIFSADAITTPSDYGRAFMISDRSTVDYDVEYTLRSDLCVGVTLLVDHVLVGDAEDGVYAQIYHILSNKVTGSSGSDVYTKNIILHIDKENMQIWATATFDQTQVAQKASADSEDITYYFAKVVGDGYSGNAAGKDGNVDGIKIYYWNNSISNSNGTDNFKQTSLDDTNNRAGGIATGTPVKSDGTTINASGDDNTIYVDLSNPIAYEIPKAGGNLTYSSGKGWTGSDKHNAKAYIYKVSIPSWATSFAWADSNGFPYWQYGSGNFSQPGPVLNPNRVYCFYELSGSYYTCAARLDESLWSQNSAANADEAAKFIKYESTNVIKYNADTTSASKDVNPAMNAKLVDVYKDRGIENELYFGSFYSQYDNSSVPVFSDSKTPIKWKIWNNLAQRKYGDINSSSSYKYVGQCSYFASVWDLAGGMLDLSRKRGLGNYALTDTYQKADLPMFDYDLLTTSNNGIATAVYQNVDFPFYKNTFNGITSYSYDSISDFNRELDETTQKYSVNTSTVAQLNKMQAYKPLNQDESFANEFVINFYMTESGKLKPTTGSDQDIVFNFSGDDDVWVYIDGVKVLDLGGAHMISAGSINLSDMKTYYRSPAMSNFNSSLNACNLDYATDTDYLYTVDIQKLFDVYGVRFDNKDATTQHTLQMFYVERGQNESNCSISFNLPQNSGLRIQNEIDTSEVNSGLVSDTLKAANNDYFQYYIENSVATDAQRTAALNYSDYGISNLPAKATNTQTSSFYTDTPSFPANNAQTITRNAYGASLLLLTGGITNGIASATTSKSGNYFTLGNLNYKLTESNYSGEITTPLSGRTTTSSNGAILNLLYGQAATFDSKITPHTWMVVKQDNKLYLPTNDGSTITRSANSVDTGVSEDGDKRYVSRFYTTTYSIKDDAANKSINTVTSTNNGMLDVTAHAADNETGYFFSNYSNTTDDTENVAATYKFVNKPNIGEIDITKEIDSGSSAPNTKASFWFDITFDNIFGIEDGDDVFETKNIRYRVYNEDGSFVERDYNTTGGIMLRHNQTAKILGIPSGTLYKVIERSRGGYQLDTVTKTSYRNGVMKKQTVMKDSAQYEKASDIDWRGPDDYGAYLADFLYVNRKVSIKVVIHYYDRKMQNGVPVDIDTRPSAATVAYSEAPDRTYEKTKTEGESEELIWINTEKYITNAVAGKLDNVVDQYSYWTTNTKAYNGIAGKDRLWYTEKADGTYEKHTEKYAKSYYHLDAHGKALETTTDADKWVTYYDANGTDLTSQFTDAVIEDDTGATETTVALYNRLARIDVWAFNEPKEYEVTVHGATSLADLANGDGVKVGNGATAKMRDYYNTRFGETAGAGSSIDDASNHMKAYGRNTQFTGLYPQQLTAVDRTIGDYKFVGWATDPLGKNIFTNDYYCGYRILSNMDLYPVYSTTPTSTFGLTITPNVKDTYVAANGTEYTRLNVTFNPYNTTGDNDDNISDIAMVNIRMADDFAVNQINLDTVRDNVLTALNNLPENSYGAHTITVTVRNKDSGADVTKPVRSEYNANELNYLVTFDEDEVSATTVKLNNKNRVMLTQTYNSSLLASGKSCYKLLVLGAMKYNGTWTISNNYLHYVGGVCQ